MKVAVFGAAGWVGRAILANFADRHEVRAFDQDPKAWERWKDVDGEWSDGEVVHGDIADFGAVDYALKGQEGIVHTAVYNARAGGHYAVDDPQPFLVNLKGLWNVLEAARRRGIGRVVHIGSCQAVHPPRPLLHSRREKTRRVLIRGVQAAARGDVPAISRSPQIVHRRPAARLYRGQ